MTEQILRPKSRPQDDRLLFVVLSGSERPGSACHSEERSEEGARGWFSQNQKQILPLLRMTDRFPRILQAFGLQNDQNRDSSP